ncbi:hypothetical protein LWI28_028880 [Acer negundo]|uniref:Uncharacterized protein n=1 Tax=Acer negundo TaxID=4023 RepID=A0AAD5IC33_ACENE|nr:hypothetical protein LWI28_028880 [Acer negundo]
MKYEICLQWKFYQGHISGVNVEKFDDKYFAKESKVCSLYVVREGRRDKALRIWSFCVPLIVQSSRVEELVREGRRDKAM